MPSYKPTPEGVNGKTRGNSSQTPPERQDVPPADDRAAETAALMAVYKRTAKTLQERQDRLKAEADLIALGAIPDPNPQAKPPPEPMPIGNPSRTWTVNTRAGGPPPEPELVPRLASGIKPEEETWLWPGRIPANRITVILGQAGAGKSTLFRWLMTQITRKGSVWPEGERVDTGQVIAFSSEANAAQDDVAELIAAGANMNLIDMPTDVDHKDDRGPRGFRLSEHIRALEKRVKDLGNVRAVLLDPLGSFLAGVNTRDENEVRELLTPYGRLANKLNFAFILAMHPNKDEEKDIASRACGSQAFIAISRAAWYVSQNPYQENKRALTIIKANPKDIIRTGLSYGRDDRTILSWDSDPLMMTASELDLLMNTKRRHAANEAVKAAGRPKTSRTTAEGHILEALEAGPRLKKELIAEAAQAGIDRSTHRRAAADLIKAGRVVADGSVLKLAPQLPLRDSEQTPEADPHP
jgi:putative DNA primase/helicase